MTLWPFCMLYVQHLTTVKSGTNSSLQKCIAGSIQETLKNIDSWAPSHRDANEKNPGLGPSIRIFKHSPGDSNIQAKIVNHCTIKIKKWGTMPGHTRNP